MMSMMKNPLMLLPHLLTIRKKETIFFHPQNLLNCNGAFAIKKHNQASLISKAAEAFNLKKRRERGPACWRTGRCPNVKYFGGKKKKIVCFSTVCCKYVFRRNILENFEAFVEDSSSSDKNDLFFVNCPPRAKIIKNI